MRDVHWMLSLNSHVQYIPSCIPPPRKGITDNSILNAYRKAANVLIQHVSLESSHSSFPEHIETSSLTSISYATY